MGEKDLQNVSDGFLNKLYCFRSAEDKMSDFVYEKLTIHQLPNTIYPKKWLKILGNFYGAEGGTIPQIFCSRWMK